MIVAAFLLAALVVLCISCQNEVEYVYEPSISLAAMPNKTSYFVGEKLDLTGLRISCVQKDGSVVDVSDYTTEPAPGSTLEKVGSTKVTVAYKTRTLSFEVAVSEVTASRLYLKTAPKSAYYDGQTLDLSNIELTLLKTDGSEETISNFTAEPADGTPLFLQEETEDDVATSNITLSYGDLSCSFDVSVYAVQLRSLVIKSPPAQTVYYVGDTLDMSGLALEATFSDGTVRNVAGECHISSETTFTEEGNHTVTVSFLGTECAFPVTVLQSFFKFCEQPQDIEMPLYAENRTLSAAVMPDCDGSVAFSWYRKLPKESAFSKIAEANPVAAAYGVAVANELALPKTDYMTAEYYCVATLTRGTLKKTVESGVATVVQMVDTGLPCLEITTDGGTDITSKEEYVSADFNLIDSAGDGLNLSGIKIKGRGNSSWGMPKKSYTLKFGKKNAVLGMKESKKWVLIANYADKSLLRNYYAYYLGNTFFKNMEWNPNFKSIDFILNGEYKGTYLLGEQIKIDENRVNVQNIADSVSGKGKDLNGDGVVNEKDGGFIFEVNTTRMDEAYNYRTTRGIGMSLKDPDVDDFVGNETVVTNFMETVLQTAEDVLYSEQYADAENGYAKYLDVDSFIDWYLVNELAKNCDASWFSSVYLYYNPADGKLHMGPLWDFDIGFGNINYNGCDDYTGFGIKKSGWHNRLFTDPAFVAKVKARWNEVKGELKTSINTDIHAKTDEIGYSAALNFTRWQILGRYVWPNAAGYESRTTYQSEVDYLLKWLNNRWTWLDGAINAP